MYEETLKKAMAGNAKAMYDLAQLYDSGALDDNYDENYIYWLKRFTESDEINEIIKGIDDENYDPDIDVLESFALLPLMGNAFLCLGLYYKNSDSLKEKEYAAQCLLYAWEATKCDYVPLDDEYDVKTDIVSLMTQLNDEIGQEKGNN